MRKALIAALAACWILAVADTAQAATIHACVKPKSGATRIVGAKAKCRRGEQKLAWNTEGPRGPAGLNGANGAPGGSGLAGASGAGPLFAAGSNTQVHVTAGTELVSKVVPPGDYMIWGKVDLLENSNKEEDQLVACRLTAYPGIAESEEEETVDESISEEFLGARGGGSFGAGVTLPLAGTYVTSVTSTVLVSCGKEGGSAVVTSLLAQIQALGVTSIS